MRAVVYDAPQSFAVVDLPDLVPRPGEVRLRVELTGVCGTDLHIHEGRFMSRFPLTPGHEVVGRIDSVGIGVEELGLGLRIVPDGNWACGKCEECARGRPLFCRDLTALGSTGSGGFAEQMVVPASQCFAIGELRSDLAVLAEPTACALHGMEVLQMSRGADVLIFGAGPTGL